MRVRIQSRSRLLGWPWRVFDLPLRAGTVAMWVGLSLLPGVGAEGQTPATRVTDIAISSKAIRTGVKRLGINLGGENFYDSGQILRNLVARNPGFEGGTLQSILRCKSVTATSCTDGNQYTVWPENFLKGAQFQFISGPAAGLSGTVVASTRSGAAGPGSGVTFNFRRPARAPSADDFVIVRLDQPGGAETGWWTDTAHSGASFATEFHDLSPHTVGKQALRIRASGPDQSARLDSYFDTYPNRSFVQLRGRYTLSFRAKGAGGNNMIAVGITRNGTRRGNVVLLPRIPVQLTDAWKDYTYDFYAAEDGTLNGPVDLDFSVAGAEVLLDDVSLEAAAAKNNPTAFRNEVVDTLRDLKPGILRYTDNGADTASTIDSMIAPPFARTRFASSTQVATQEQIALGLNEVLELCKAVNAEPWYALPATATPEETAHLIEYLAGAPTTPYGARRAAAGQTEPWTEVFPTIHLEFGNELWNSIFYGAVIADPAAYGRRAAQLFAAARNSASFKADKFDLILGSFAVNPWWTGEELAHSAHYDSIAVAPYLFAKLVDTTSEEAVFGPMFAEPELIDTRGYMFQQAKAARGAARPANLTVYEVGLGTDQGTASQAEVNTFIPSLGGGLTVADHMLLALRDLGVLVQATYSLSGYANTFHNPKDPAELTPLWGMVVDMGGATNLRRPVFLAEQLVNQALLPTMLATRLTGANPVWKQVANANNDIHLEQAHALQVFAFSDGIRHSLIAINLNRETSLPITFSGDIVPSGHVEVSQLASTHVTDTNEEKDTVRLTHTALDDFKSGTPYPLPPYSMTVLSWSREQ